MSTTSLALRGLRAAADPISDRRRQLAAPDLERYARDPFAHADDGHIAILDLVTHRIVPFRPWPHQRAAAGDWIDLDHLAATGDVVFRDFHWEKSRQMGGTETFAVLVHWLLTYHDVQGGILHQRLAEVADSGPTTRSFFGRIKFIQEARHPDGQLYLPAAFRAPLRFVGGTAPLIRNEAYQSRFFIGEGQRPDPTRGGTYAYFLLDEAARLAWPRSIQAAINRSTPTGKVYLSTPKGRDELFYKLKESRPLRLRFRRDHWSDHPVYGQGRHIAAQPPRLDPDTKQRVPGGHSSQPDAAAAAAAYACPGCAGTIAGLPWDPRDPHRAHRYPGKLTSPWYDGEVASMTDEEVAAELDIDYTGSLIGRVYPEFSTDVHALEHIPYEPKVKLELCWDYGLDTTAIGILQDAPSEVRMIGELEIGDSTPEEVTAALLAVLRTLGVSERELALRREWLQVGDPAGEGRTLSSGKPLVADYRKHDLNIVSAYQPVSRTINAVKRMLNGYPKPFRISADTCPLTVEHFGQNRWPLDRTGRRKLGATVPFEDSHNHMMRALAYWAAWKFPPPDDRDHLPDPEHAEDPSWPLDQFAVDELEESGLAWDMEL